MAMTNRKLVFLSITIFISIFTLTNSSDNLGLEERFLQCFSSYLGKPNSASQVLFRKNSSSYQPLLQSSIRNLRFISSTALRPNLIVTPNDLSHIQTAIICSKKQGMQIRVRSGGHDYEGLSYISNVPFLIIDLVNFRSISIAIEEGTAWVSAGATLGELYYAIAKTSNIHGFPAGSCPTVGVGGHLSGGGFGTIFRQYGLAADKVIDAQMVDVNGKILNRTLMGEDLFWAMRGGGGSSFGVITAWKVKLVLVPEKVTIFNIPKTLEQGATRIFMKWQTIADKLPGELFVHSVMGVVNSSSLLGRKTVKVSFTGLYLGEADKLISLLQNNFAELGLKLEDCMEMSWIQSVLYFVDYLITESFDC